MKKRILLSLVSLFAMTTMWASLIQNYYVEASGDAGKTGQTATLKLNLKNQATVNTWSCTVVLPAGVTFVEGSAVYDEARYATAPTLTATANADGSVSFTCAGEVTGTQGAVASFQVQIAADVTPEVYPVVTKDFVFMIGTEVYTLDGEKEFPWTIEAGSTEPNFDVNDDTKVDVADVQFLLIKIADGNNDPKYDLNGDTKVDVADVQTLLIWIADHA